MGDHLARHTCSCEKRNDETSHLSWEELTDIIGTKNFHFSVFPPLPNWIPIHYLARNELSKIQRERTCLSQYRQWAAEIREQYGSMTDYLLSNRLPKSWGRPPFSPALSRPFEDPSDFRVLLNDWPYGLDSNITHIIVWSRTPIATQFADGDMTSSGRSSIEAFVQRYFVDRLPGRSRDQVLWFRNYGELRSVGAIEHFHVLVRDVDAHIVQAWTEGK